MIVFARAGRPPKAEVRGSNPFGRANNNKDLARTANASADHASAECPRNTFGTRSGKATGDPPKTPKKRRPAPPASGNGPNRNARPEQKKNTKLGAETQAGERHFFYVTHGQMNIGFVAQAGNEFAASDADGRKIGVFESLKAASDAISERCGGAL